MSVVCNAHTQTVCCYDHAEMQRQFHSCMHLWADINVMIEVISHSVAMESWILLLHLQAFMFHAKLLEAIVMTISHLQ